ncbi:uncharacterized protein LOC113550039 [Rhopalosiphum maidis]|uniref:uncharacterized protein LOC113550039 n=1 Tax=Rhopalosiphum maidis TaxID=43146 RepID=UPI000EFF2047|nr:uncharacterized protein LOC113550039 [Rhopalosiphum maidis]
MERLKPHLSAKEKRDRKKNLKKNRNSNNVVDGPSTSTFVTDHYTWPDLLESVNRRTKNGFSSTSNKRSPVEKAKIPSNTYLANKEKRDRTNNQTSHGIGAPSTSTSVTVHNTLPDLLESQQRQSNNNQIEDKKSSLACISPITFSGSTVANPAKRKRERFLILKLNTK